MLQIIYLLLITMIALAECTSPGCGGKMVYQTCYWVTSTKQSAYSGDTDCGSVHGGRLGIIPNQSVLDSVIIYRQDKGHTLTEYFLGYNDSTNSASSAVHLWSGGVQSWTNWKTGQPDNGLQMCVVMNGSDGLWYDASCSTNYYGLCSTLVSSITTTTSTPPPTTQDVTMTTAMCNCQCHIPSNLTMEEFEEIIRTLTLDKKTLNSFTRKKISADDKRTSAKAVGSFGAIFLTFIFGGLFLQDGPTLLFHIKVFTQPRES